MEKVILVDKNDNEVGTMEKMEAHRKAVLHRAISVFIVNSKGDWLLQRRSPEKYHSPGLWTNTCCSHPFPGETNIKAAHRRLSEEMGMQSDLKEIFHFLYKEKLGNNLFEHELDHVFIGITNESPVINTDEAIDWKYITYSDLAIDIRNNPEKYTVWFRNIAKKVNDYLNTENER